MTSLPSEFSPHVAVGILLLHFVGDFALQSRWMGRNKSHNWRALAAHVVIYTITIGVGTMLWASPWWALANGLAHGAVDAVTSRITSWAWSRGRERLFFTVIGADQFIHAAVLFFTWR